MSATATAWLARHGNFRTGAPRRRDDVVVSVVSTVDIDAPLEQVYVLVADVTRTGEWSPERVRCRWLDGATSAEQGARYRGTSWNGWRRWSTTSTLRTANVEDGLTWDVTYLGRPVARWHYGFELLGDGRTRLTESVDDHRERWLRVVSPWITGSRDRAERNADTIGTSLERIKAIVETR